MVMRSEESAVHERVEELIAVFRRGDGSARERARENLAIIGRPAIGPLTRAMFDRDHRVRWESIKAVSEICDSRCARFLVKALEDEEFDVRWIAARGLIKMRWSGVEPLLRALARRRTSVLTLRGAHHVIGELIRRRESEILSPVWQALNGPEPSLAVPPVAMDALRKIRERRHQRIAA